MKSGTTEYLDLVYDEDSRGRYTKRDNHTTNADPTDSFYKYDPKSRLTCGAKVSGYAAGTAGTAADLDEDLEAAAVEHLLAEGRR